MQNSIVVIGIGEMGSVFARALLKSGYPVVPVTHQSSIQDIHANFPAPEYVVIAVGESALPKVLADLPTSWAKCVILLQNELLPGDYQQLSNPTIISVWFEKKKGQNSLEIMPSPVFGPAATTIQQALSTLGLHADIMQTEAEMFNQLVVKNLYILTTNIAGLAVGGTVGELWANHKTLANDVIDDVICLQQALTGKTLNKEELLRSVLRAFNGDLKHKCMGRSAPARLQRALEHAENFNLDLPTLRKISIMETY